jgi:hypothetical protein
MELRFLDNLNKEQGILNIVKNPAIKRNMRFKLIMLIMDKEQLVTLKVNL